MDGARRQDYLTRRLDGPRDLPADNLNPAGTVTIEEDSGRVGVQEQGEVRTAEVRPQESARRADPRAIGGNVHVDVTGPRAHWAVHIVDNREAHLPGGFEE